MAWIQETADDGTQTSEDKWLKFPDNEVIDKSVEVTFRVLETIPEDTWRHWLENRMFNCPGIEACPVCKVRNIALKAAGKDPDAKKAIQNKYRTDHRFFFNVLHEGKTKVYSFGSGVAKDLKIFSEKYSDAYGDLRNYDITVMKRKTGRLPQNVEYTVLPVFPARELTEGEVAASEVRYDLSYMVTPASRDDLVLVAQGELPERPDKNEGSSEESPKVGNKKATLADIMMLKALLESRGDGLELAHFGIVDGEEISKAVVDQLIADIKKSK